MIVRNLLLALTVVSGCLAACDKIAAEDIEEIARVHLQTALWKLS
jgi:hypothetical protein